MFYAKAGLKGDSNDSTKMDPGVLCGDDFGVGAVYGFSNTGGGRHMRNRLSKMFDEGTFGRRYVYESAPAFLLGIKLYAWV